MIKLLSLFSGIGAFEAALRRGGYQFETVNYCEIDPYASKAYSQIHDIPEEKNLHDVREVNPLLLNNINLVTYGFPCVDISVAGKQEGFFKKDGSVTRSGLFFEALRIIEFLQPEYAICENVKALTSKKFEKEFNTVLNSLAEVGYNNYWKVLNAKDYGIPQNRERIFIISIRKDIDTGTFAFPEKQELKLRVKDILENNVDEKYYINTEKARQLIKKLLDKNRITGVEVCDATVNAPNVRDISNQRSWGTAVIEPHVKQIGNIVTTGNFKNPQRGRIYDSKGISPCLNTMQGGGLEPKFIEPVICASRGRNSDNPGDMTAGAPTEQRLEVNMNGVSNTLTTVQKDNYVFDSYRIRKLTPKECFRLMGFSDEEFNRIKGVSNTQLYKMAGNSIVVNVLEAIFKQLFKENYKE